jgi:hypothetical protein
MPGTRVSFSYVPLFWTAYIVKNHHTEKESNVPDRDEKSFFFNKIA